MYKKRLCQDYCLDAVFFLCELIGFFLCRESLFVDCFIVYLSYIYSIFMVYLSYIYSMLKVAVSMVLSWVS